MPAQSTSNQSSYVLSTNNLQPKQMLSPMHRTFTAAQLLRAELGLSNPAWINKVMLSLHRIQQRRVLRIHCTAIRKLQRQRHTVRTQVACRRRSHTPLDVEYNHGNKHRIYSSIQTSQRLEDTILQQYNPPKIIIQPPTSMLGRYRTMHSLDPTWEQVWNTSIIPANLARQRAPRSLNLRSCTSNKCNIWSIQRPHIPNGIGTFRKVTSCKLLHQVEG